MEDEEILEKYTTLDSVEDLHPGLYYLLKEGYLTIIKKETKNDELFEYTRLTDKGIEEFHKYQEKYHKNSLTAFGNYLRKKGDNDEV